MNSLRFPSRDHNVFIYDQIKVFFKHTDYYGFVHLYNFLEWMGSAREAFFSKVFPDFITNEELSALSMVTTRAEYDHLADARFGDEIEVLVFTEKVRRISFDLVFEFFNKNDDEKLGLGRQTLVFLQRNSIRPAHIPELLYTEIKNGERKLPVT